MKATYFTFLLIFFVTHGVQAEKLAHIANLKQLTFNENSIAPSFSPTNSSLLAFTSSKYQGIYVLHLTKGLNMLGSTVQDPEPLTNAPQAGFEFSWSPDGKFIISRFSVGAQTRLGMFDLQTRQYIDVSGNAQSISIPTLRQQQMFFTQNNIDFMLSLNQPSSSKKLQAFQVKQQSLPLLEKEGDILVGHQKVNREGSQCWLPNVSPDGMKVAFECWEGLYIYHIHPRNLIFIGRGADPSWSRDSQLLVYEKTTDNGYDLVSSDIYMIHNDGTQQINLTRAYSKTARRPALSPDSKQVAMDIDGDIYVGDIQ